MDIYCLTNIFILELFFFFYCFFFFLNVHLILVYHRGNNCDTEIPKRKCILPIASYRSHKHSLYMYISDCINAQNLETEDTHVHLNSETKKKSNFAFINTIFKQFNYKISHLKTHISILSNKIRYSLVCIK